MSTKESTTETSQKPVIPATSSVSEPSKTNDSPNSNEPVVIENHSLQADSAQTQSSTENKAVVVSTSTSSANSAGHVGEQGASNEPSGSTPTQLVKNENNVSQKSQKPRKSQQTPKASNRGYPWKNLDLAEIWEKAAMHHKMASQYERRGGNFAYPNGVAPYLHRRKKISSHG